MRKLPLEIRLRCSEKFYKAVKKYAASHGMTQAAAVRDLTRTQLRYLTWVANRGKRGPSDSDLRHYGEEALKRAPQATETQVRDAIARRAGKFVNYSAIQRVAAELLEGQSE